MAVTNAPNGGLDGGTAIDAETPENHAKHVHSSASRQSRELHLSRLVARLNALFERFGCTPFCARDAWPEEALKPMLESYAHDAASTGVYPKSHAETLVGDLILTDIGKEKDAPRATLWKIRQIGESGTELGIGS
jgi:hypothetical protein